MKLIALQTIPQFGRTRIEKHQVFEASEREARKLLSRRIAKMADAPENKMAADPENKSAGARPSPAVGVEVPSSASPAAQASPQTTATPSDDGEKPRRKRQSRMWEDPEQ